MDPIAVPPAIGFKAIGVGNTKGYELISQGEIKAIKIGRATRLVVDSLKDYVARRAADQREAA